MVVYVPTIAATVDRQNHVYRNDDAFGPESGVFHKKRPHFPYPYKARQSFAAHTIFQLF